MKMKREPVDVEREKFINISAMKDITKMASKFLPLVALVEFALFLYYLFVAISERTVSAICVDASLLVLTVISVVTYILVEKKRKRISDNYRFVMILQDIYAVSICLWICLMAPTELFQGGETSLAIYVLIMTLVSVLCFFKPLIFGTFEFIFLAVILMLQHIFKIETDLLTGIVFSAFSIAAQSLVYSIKRNLYEREYELMYTRERESLDAHYDNLTGFLNRRSYDEKIDELEKKGLPEDFVFVSMDVNSLKKVNDSLGHKAGDELLVGAAKVIKQAFSSYGYIFRTGGDEFIGLLNVDKDEMDTKIQEEFYRIMSEWRGDRYGITLSISMGYVYHSDYPQLSLAGLEKAADQKMYEKKRKYYEKNGIDRRHVGQDA